MSTHPLPNALCIDDLDRLDFAKSGGLIPAIVQHARTKQVLMQGYMSREAVQKTFEDGAVTFFSRSKARRFPSRSRNF
jgi:phosphoribosyl-ATP pyrophosphohydrolase/phosphoribosyl-AMP cyclohydrolase